MSDYISREAALEAFENADADVMEDYGDGTSDWGFGRENIRETLNSVPAADVAEVRHGEWLLKHIGHGHYWECSECHTNPCIYVTENTKFCPNCGAKMDLEELK